METIPTWIEAGMVIVTILTLYFFYKANASSKIIIALLLWLTLHAIVAMNGFYLKTDALPPRFSLTIFPPVLLSVLLFFTNAGRNFIDSLDVKWLTLLHTVRIPVEFLLFNLYIYKAIPREMTFEGNNLDIISGFTAPVAYYLFFVKKIIGKKLFIAWNIACILLLANIVITAILAAPFPFQQLAFDQPNVAILYFPFVWLPCCIVPLVLFSHLANIRKILNVAPATDLSLKTGNIF